MASRHANDVIASLGDIIPDGKVLYKFLSPHLLAVATLTQPDPREGGTLTVSVIDTVKASISFATLHVLHAMPEIPQSPLIINIILFQTSFA